MSIVSPFTKTVVASMRHLYPEILADKSFDNTGLLLEAPIPHHAPRKANSVLLTIDLTKAVADEAIEGNHSTVIAYHPIIFRGLKSLTFNDSQQQSLLRLASHGVSVYSPHTAVDIVPSGMADWLCDIVAGKIEPAPEPQAFTAASEEGKPWNPPASDPTSEVDVTTSEEDESVTKDPTTTKQPAHPVGDDVKTKAKSKRPSTIHRTYSKPAYPSRNTDNDSLPDRTLSLIPITSTSTFHPSLLPHTRTVITPSPSSSLTTANSPHDSPIYNSTNTGSGRLLTFTTPQPLSTLITRIAHATGTPKGFPVAIPQSTPLESITIRTVAICPGSGGSVVSKCSPPADLVFTGEMSHHEALAIIERGGCVVALFHSNSERGYLDAVLRGGLEEEVKRRWDEERRGREVEGEEGSEGVDGMVKEILDDESVNVVVSARDRDPFGIVVLQESHVEGEKVN